MLRRREWATLHEGVYLDHTGAPSWLQRAWGAVLLAEPAALTHESAIRASDGPGRRDRSDRLPVHIAIDRKRTILEPEGVVIHRVSHLDTRAQWNRSPPMVRIEHALIDVAADAESGRPSLVPHRRSA